MIAHSIFVYAAFFAICFTPPSSCVQMEQFNDNNNVDMASDSSDASGDNGAPVLQGLDPDVAKTEGFGPAENAPENGGEQDVVAASDTTAPESPDPNAGQTDVSAQDAKLEELKLPTVPEGLPKMDDGVAEQEPKAEDLGPTDYGTDLRQTVVPLASNFENMAQAIQLQQATQQTDVDVVESARLRGAAEMTASGLKKMAELADEATQVTRMSCKNKLYAAHVSFMENTEKLRSSLKTCTDDVQQCQADSGRFTKVLEKMKKELEQETDKRLAAEDRVQSWQNAAKESERMLESARKKMADLGYSI